MTKFIIISAALHSTFASAAAPRSTDVGYVGDAANFRAHLGGGRFHFTEQATPRQLIVKPCNEKILAEFWDDLSTHARVLADDPGRSALTPKGATLTLNGDAHAVGRYDSLYYYFNRMPKEAAVVLNQVARACQDGPTVGTRDTDADYSRDIQPLVDQRTRAAFGRRIRMIEARVAWLESRAPVAPSTSLRAYQAAQLMAQAEGADSGAADPLVGRVRARLGELGAKNFAWTADAFSKRRRDDGDAALMSAAVLDATEIAAAAEGARADLGDLWPAVGEDFSRARLLHDLPENGPSLAALQALAFQRARLGALRELATNPEWRARLDERPNPFGSATTRARLLERERASLQTTRAALAKASPYDSAVCRYLGDLATAADQPRLSAGPKTEGHRAPAADPSNPAQLLTTLKARLRAEIDAETAAGRTWRALPNSDRTRRTIVSFAGAAGDDSTASGAADRVCRALIK